MSSLLGSLGKASIDQRRPLLIGERHARLPLLTSPVDCKARCVDFLRWVWTTQQKVIQEVFAAVL